MVVRDLRLITSKGATLGAVVVLKIGMSIDAHGSDLG